MLQPGGAGEEDKDTLRMERKEQRRYLTVSFNAVIIIIIIAIIRSE